MKKYSSLLTINGLVPTYAHTDSLVIQIYRLSLSNSGIKISSIVSTPLHTDDAAN